MQRKLNLANSNISTRRNAQPTIIYNQFNAFRDEASKTELEIKGKMALN